MMSSSALAGMGFAALLYGASPALAAVVTPDLQTPKRFTVLAWTTVTNTGASVLVTGIVFSVFMGFFGGLLPASRAAFTKITDALRQVG